MIANFFSKTKPISTLFIVGSLLFIYVFSIVLHTNEEITLTFMAIRGFNFMLLLIILFTINFIIRKNNLVRDNSYAILLFVLLLGMFPFSMLTFNLLIVNLILLLAYRRIYSLRTSKETKQKLFDSAFWIGIVTLIYPWCSLVLLLIYGAIFLFDKASLRNMIIPLIGFIAPILIYGTFLYAINDMDTLNKVLEFEYSFYYRAFNAIELIIPLSLVSALLLWSIFPTSYKINIVNNEFKNSWFLMVLNLFILVLVTIPWASKNGGELIFLFFPIAVIFTNYLQIIEENWFKEVFLYSLVAVMLSAYIL